MGIYLGIGGYPVHVNRRSNGQTGLRVELDIVHPGQMLDIYQKFRGEEAIPHTDKNVRSTQERTRFAGMLSQKGAGLGQTFRLNIIKLG